MTSPLGGIVPVGIGAVSGVAGATTGVPQAQNADGFAAVLASSFDALQGTQKTADALATQAVCDAVLDSAEHHKWETVVPV